MPVEQIDRAQATLEEGFGLPTILIADDDTVSRMKLRRVLELELGALVLEARDGIEAWEIIQKRPVQIVVSDWMMPGLDGPGLCRRIRERGSSFYTYFILLTGRQEQADLVQGMDSGADDYIRKPFDAEEMKSRLKAGLRVVSLERNLAERNVQLAGMNLELEQAIEAAGQVQRGMLPSARQMQQTNQESGLSLAYRYEACQNLGGDVLGMVRLSSVGDFAVFLADVSGHGIAASLSAVSLYTKLQTLIAADPEPLSVVTQANRFCSENMPEHVYATMIYLRFRPTARAVDFIVAGHPALIYIDAQGRSLEYHSSFPPLGLFDDNPQPEDVQHLTLSSGDRLVAYTDGVIETCNQAGELFSDGLLIEQISAMHCENVDTMASRILESITAWRGAGSSLSDDLSIVTVGCH